MALLKKSKLSNFYKTNFYRRQNKSILGWAGGFLIKIAKNKKDFQQSFA